jgi:1-acyl-sn-glycerol-3-phosphate acyltransferase
LFLEKNDKPFSDAEIDAFINQALAFEIPRRDFEKLHQFIHFYFPTTIVGLENIPNEPTLFIGNHCLFGVDAIILVTEVFQQTGRCLRVTADQFFFQLTSGEFFQKRGIVLANPRICGALMDAGADLVVYPGGAYESTKPESQKYSLHWSQRSGFVRMAAQHGYHITPFGMVGPDDCYGHLLEGRDLLDTRPGKLLTRFGLTDKLRRDILPPLPSGMLGTLLPKPQPAFLAFGKPLAVPQFEGGEVPVDVLQSVRQETATRIDGLLRDMLLQRAQQQPGWPRRWLL